MKFRLIEKTEANQTVDGAKNSASYDVAGIGGDSIAFVVTASSSSSPTGTTVQLQGSLDDTNWVNVGSAVSVTGDGSFSVSQDRPPYRYYRVALAHSSGSYVATTKVLVKGDLN